MRPPCCDCSQACARIPTERERMNRPRPSAGEKQMICMCGEAKRSCTQRRKRVAEHGERLAALQLIRVITCCQLGKTGKTVGDSFDGAEPARARANCSKKCGEDGGRGFVAPIAEQAGEADAEDGAVEPALFFGGFGHEGAVYRRQWPVKSWNEDLNSALRKGFQERAR